MVLANRNLSVEVRVRPVRITAKAVTARDMDVVFIATIFFSLPQIRNTFKFGNFPLNQVTIKLGLGLCSTGTAMSVVKTTLKQKPVVWLIHEELARRLAIVKRFGIVGIKVT